MSGPIPSRQPSVTSPPATPSRRPSALAGGGTAERRARREQFRSFYGLKGGPATSGQGVDESNSTQSNREGGPSKAKREDVKDRLDIGQSSQLPSDRRLKLTIQIRLDLTPRHTMRI